MTKPPLTIGGIACVALGALLALPSGACALLVSRQIDLATNLMFAGLPLFGGFALIWLGLRMRRSPP